jgi:CBS domain-containing protein
MDISIETLLRRKGRDVFSVAPDCTVYDALKVLAEKDIGALLVFESEKLVGIFSERDYARKVILKGKHSRETAVREIMTEKVITVDAGEDIGNCMDLMTAKHIRHLPVLKDGVIAGVISIGDIVKTIISEQESTIKDLEKYIVGGR